MLAGLLTLVLLVFAGILYNTQIVNHDYYVAQSIRTIAGRKDGSLPGLSSLTAAAR